MTAPNPVANGRSAGLVQATHSKVSFDTVVKVAAAADAANHATLDLAQLVLPVSINGLGNHVLVPSCAAESGPHHAGTNAPKNAIDIRLSIVSVVRPPHPTRSKALDFMQMMLFWRSMRNNSSGTNGVGASRRPSSRAGLGYYSPPMEHQSMGRKSTQFTIECGYMFEEPMSVGPENPADNDDASSGVAISNISMRNVEENALEDELTTYMAELRAREQR